MRSHPRPAAMSARLTTLIVGSCVVSQHSRPQRRGEGLAEARERDECPGTIRRGGGDLADAAQAA